MSAKSFFKSTAFKCIVVLLSIVLICGVFLTICNSLFFVSAEERKDRAVAKIYGKAVPTEDVSFTDEQANQENAIVIEAYKVTEDGNYLLKTKGTGGFSGGTVTCWVVVEMGTNSVSGVGKVVIDSNEGQSYISKITSSFLASFDKNYEDGIVYSPDEGFLSSGATKSSTAICNAVNGSISFIKTAVLGETTTDPLEGFEFTSNISANSTTFEKQSDGSVKFSVTTKGGNDSDTCKAEIVVGADGKIVSYTLTKNGGTNQTYQGHVEALNLSTLMVGKTKQDILNIIKTSDGSYDNSKIDKDTLQSGATETKYLCLYAGLFATANYEKVGGNS